MPEAKLVGDCEGPGNEVLGVEVSAGDVQVGLYLFGSQVQSFISLLYHVGPLLVSPEVPWHCLQSAVVCCVS